jgi:lipopolysaccharide transport system ATP-binding protein
MKVEIKNVFLDYPLNTNRSSIRKEITSTIGGILLNEERKNQHYVSSLTDICLKIKEGEKIALVGPNGSGKTSLLSIISQAYPPTAGEIIINGKVTSMIVQGLGIDEDSTGYENIFLMALTYGYEMKEIKKKIDNIIDFSGLGEFINLPFYTYSSGMKTRLNFSILTSFTPDILVIDEWLTTGDKDFQIKAEKKIKSFVNEKVTLIMATHSKEIAKSYCNKFIFLEKGRIVKSGNVNNLENLI